MTEPPLRIGMLAPISHPFPPPGYGPWEQVCHDLTEGLVALGHRVYLFAPVGSATSAVLIDTVPAPLSTAPDSARPDARVWEEHHIAAAMRQSVELGLDLVHSHLGVHALGFAPLLAIPLLTTLHGVAWDRNLHLVLDAHREEAFVSLSESERSFFPGLNYVATVGNGIDLSTVAPGGGGERLAFVGRMAPEKAPDLAIEVALAADRPIVLAGTVEDRHRDFFEERVASRLRAGRVDYLGAISQPEVKELVGECAALLMPLRWDEPFGLVVVESLAVGTPVIGWRRGALPELIEDGTTGFLVDDLEGAVEAVTRLGELDRSRCRQEALDRFDFMTMAEGYVAAYRRVLGQPIASSSSARETVANLIPTSEKP